MHRFSVFFLFCLGAIPLIPALYAQDTAAYKNDPKFISSMAEAKKLIHDRQYAFAIDSYKKANKIAGGKDAGCLQGLLDIQMSVADLPHAKLMRAIELLGTRVAPLVRRALASGTPALSSTKSKRAA